MWYHCGIVEGDGNSRVRLDGGLIMIRTRHESWCPATHLFGKEASHNPQPTPSCSIAALTPRCGGPSRPDP